ncbi:hypothetical protein GDO81_002536 [Engystomops pustulosus]|uniref:Uncharacterized protein n=1 Tax=Engystomops pustulosus TaxID=76066 RepID=A0AAV7DPS7_ENGPU|nr:hypothetical protein GDO81_002536 [Engystomops pustulosus]
MGKKKKVSLCNKAKLNTGVLVQQSQVRGSQNLEPGLQAATKANTLHESDLIFMKHLCSMIEYNPAAVVSHTSGHDEYSREPNNMVQQLQDEMKTLRFVYEGEIADWKWQLEASDKENVKLKKELDSIRRSCCSNGKMWRWVCLEWTMSLRRSLMR